MKHNLDHLPGIPLHSKRRGIQGPVKVRGPQLGGCPAADAQAEPAMDLSGESRSRHEI